MKNKNQNEIKLTLQKKSKISSPTDLARVAAPKLAQIMYNALRVGPRVILRSAFELLRANTITRVLSAVVLLSIDTISLLRGRISKKQYIINLGLALMLLVGGTAGWVLGNNAAGVIAENVALGVFAGLVGAGVFGAVFATLWEKTITLFLKTDTEEMLDIFNAVFLELSTQHGLSWEQMQQAKEAINIDIKIINQIFATKDRHTFAKDMLEPCIMEAKNAKGNPDRL
ncbi:MAG: hypothetical protein FWG63_06735 [Defluviitaleaceae bacterium]|nr:hypothetical protein [Defluviitaleaceae bacterium]